MNLTKDIKQLDNAIDEYILASDTLLKTIKAKKIPITKIALLAGLSRTTLFDRIRDYRLSPFQYRNVIRAINEIESSNN